jgi:hypothetical protein
VSRGDRRAIPLAHVAYSLALPLDYLEALVKAGELHVFEAEGQTCITVEDVDALASKVHHPTGELPRGGIRRMGKGPTVKP